MCDRTVLSLIDSRVPISRLLSPRATRARTLRSCSVSAASPVPETMRAVSPPATDGSRYMSPRAACLMACSTWSGEASLST
jgi:hypothetical protein